jgi:molybdopterin synthase sulfur carrier subunit
MSVRVRIPAPLRAVTDGESEVSLAAGSLSECLAALESRFPEIGQRIKDEQGELRRFVNVYVNGEDIRFLQGMDTGLNEGDEVSIIPAVAGG